MGDLISPEDDIFRPAISMSPNDLSYNFRFMNFQEETALSEIYFQEKKGSNVRYIIVYIEDDLRVCSFLGMLTICVNNSEMANYTTKGYQLIAYCN